MVNRDKSFDISDREAAVRYDTVTIKKMSEHDISVMKELIEETNKKGYHIQYYFQLGFMDLECRDLFPVISKFVWCFDDPAFSIRLLAYLGVPKLYEATPFLIEAFKKKAQWKLGFPNSLETTRSAASSSLLRIKDGKFQEEYRKLIADKETHDDAGFLVQLLGYFDSQTNYDFLLNLLSDDSINIKIPAIQALGRFKTHADPLIEVLADIIEKSENRDVVRVARQSLRKLEKSKQLSKSMSEKDVNA